MACSSDFAFSRHLLRDAERLLRVSLSRSPRRPSTARRAPVLSAWQAVPAASLQGQAAFDEAVVRLSAGMLKSAQLPQSVAERLDVIAPSTERRRGVLTKAPNQRMRTIADLTSDFLEDVVEALKVKFRGRPAARPEDCQGPLSVAADIWQPKSNDRSQSFAALQPMV